MKARSHRFWSKRTKHDAVISTEPTVIPGSFHGLDNVPDTSIAQPFGTDLIDAFRRTCFQWSYMSFLTRISLHDLRWIMAVPTLAVAACAPQTGLRIAAIPAGSTYVAMGSSFASGPGITVSADTPANRCQRSADNYAHQLARKRGLALVDVSCGGATTDHVLGPWREQPPQIDAVTANTRLVTVTIGGNDIGLSGRLRAASCDGDAKMVDGAVAAMCEGMAAYVRNNPQAARSVSVPLVEADWARLAGALDRIAQEVHRRAPQARLVFVDYIRIVPARGSCAAVPLSDSAAALSRAVAARLEQETAAAARRAGAGLVRASVLSRGHDACAAESWATGFLPPAGASPSTFSPYHPNLAAMTGIADALSEQLGD